MLLILVLLLLLCLLWVLRVLQVLSMLRCATQGLAEQALDLLHVQVFPGSSAGICTPPVSPKGLLRLRKS